MFVVLNHALPLSTALRRECIRHTAFPPPRNAKQSRSQALTFDSTTVLGFEKTGSRFLAPMKSLIMDLKIGKPRKYVYIRWVGAYKE